jgi:protein-disulfide isomerase
MSTLKVPVSQRDHSRGGSNAIVTLVEYGDYQCPYCGAAQPVVRFLEQRYGPALRVVFRHFPLIEVHPLAMTAAEARSMRATMAGSGKCTMRSMRTSID